MEAKKIPVKKRAVIARIGRALAKEGQSLRISRSKAEISNFGDAFILDSNSNTVVAHNVSVLALATEMGLIKAFEDYVEE